MAFVSLSSLLLTLFFLLQYAAVPGQGAVSECGNGSDEMECSYCSGNSFLCNDTCLMDNDGVRCNGVSECRNSSDEMNCFICAGYSFRCNDTCLLDNDGVRCNGVSECGNGLDERNCSNCSGNSFLCNDTCLLYNGGVRCNGVPECRYGIDEMYCINCFGNSFLCNDTCLLDDDGVRCNGTSECENGLDEFNCAQCKGKAFHCDNICLASTSVCDNVSHCSNGDDEMNCNGGMKEVTLDVNFMSPSYYEIERNARTKIIKIHLNAAILRQYPNSSPVIDVLKVYKRKCRLSVQLTYSDPSECEAMKAHFDGPAVLSKYTVEVKKNDECPTAPTGSSASNGAATSCTDAGGDSGFLCINGNCVEEVTICDGNDDCGDNSDEDPLMCMCRAHHLCDNGTRCVSKYDVCDGVPHCSDGSDEQGCVCKSDEFLCDDKCLLDDSNVRCNGVPDCASGVDEENCIVCHDSAFWCDGVCLAGNFVCDNIEHCSDGTDEWNCDRDCEPDEFQCSNGRCVRQTWRCDVDDDCGDASDEANCGLSKPGDVCSPRHFTCRDGRSCIPRSHQCDEEPDCSDGSDELGCAAPSITKPPPIQKTTPLHSTFDITCQATGVPPPVFVWRFNNRHLPPNCIAIDHDGSSSLHCLRVTRSHQGTYSCEAHNSLGVTVAKPSTALTVE